MTVTGKDTGAGAPRIGNWVEPPSYPIPFQLAAFLLALRRKEVQLSGWKLEITLFTSPGPERHQIAMLAMTTTMRGKRVEAD